MKNSDDRFYRCPFKDKCQNCFASNKEGLCLALTNVDFNGRECPFYRDKDEYKDECKKLKIGRN